MQIVPLADREDLIQELAELHHAEWQHLSPSMTLAKRAEVLSKLAGRQGIPSIFIATNDSGLMGSAALVQKDMETRQDLSPWLAAVYVKEKFRGQGVASALIARCEQEAVQAGVDAWFLYTESATKLYEKLGWTLLERCDYKGEVVDVMCKKLAP